MDFIRKIVQEVVWGGQWFDTKESNRTDFPDIGDFYATAVKTKSNDLIYFYIYSKDGTKLGQLDMLGNLDYQTEPLAIGWQTASTQFKKNLKNAVRFVYLQNQKPIAKPEEELTETTVAPGGKVAKHLKFEDIDGWSAVLLEEDSHYSWRIFNKSGQEIGELKYDGQLTYDAELVGSWQIADRPFSYDERGVKNATRYIYLMTQKPLNEKEAIKEKEVLMFPDVANYVAMKQPETLNKKSFWRIYTEEGKEIIRVFQTGAIHYLIPGKYFDSGWNVAPEDAKFGYTEKGIKQAARWYFLNTQKPLKEEVPKQPKHKTEYVFPEVDGWKVEVKGIGRLDVTGEYVIDTHYVVLDKSGKVVGQMVKYPNGKIGQLIYLPNTGTAWESSRRSFDVDEKGLKQAVRFVYLMRQKPIKKKKQLSEKDNNSSSEEMTMKPGDYVYFPDIGNWFIKRDLLDPRRIAIYSAQPEKKWMGVLDLVFLPHKTERKSILYYGKHIDDEGQPATGWMEWEHGQYWDRDSKAIKNAVRYLYLKNQEEKAGLTESTGERHLLKNETVRFKDVKGYYATGMLDKKTYEANKGNNTLVYAFLYNNKDETVGTLATGGRLFVAPSPSDVQQKVDMKFPSNIKGVKNALRYIFLQYQKPIKK